MVNHSVATVHFPLTSKEVDAILAFSYMQLEDGIVPPPELDPIRRELESKIDSVIKQFPRGAFIRLGSRSPKDCFDAYKVGYRYESGIDAVKALCGSERVSDDLYLAKGHGYTPHIAVRDWIKIKPWQEFRCFIRDRKLVAISQYNYLKREVFPEITANAGSIEWTLRIKTEMIAPLLPQDNIIADYIYRLRKNGNEVINEAVLLEVNPYSPYTDPCLFDWNKDAFNAFEFRYFS